MEKKDEQQEQGKHSKKDRKKGKRKRGDGKVDHRKGKGKRELKQPEQILKARNVKAHKQAVQKHRQKQNQKHTFKMAKSKKRGR